MTEPGLEPVRLDPPLSPHKSSHETSCEHGSAHESAHSSGRGSPVLFSPVLFLDHLVSSVIQPYLFSLFVTPTHLPVPLFALLHCLSASSSTSSVWPLSCSASALPSPSSFLLLSLLHLLSALCFPSSISILFYFSAFPPSMDVEFGWYKIAMWACSCATCLAQRLNTPLHSGYSHGAQTEPPKTTLRTTWVLKGLFRKQGVACNHARSCSEQHVSDTSLKHLKQHKATQNLMHLRQNFMLLRQRLLSFRLVMSRSLHVAVVARFCNSRHFMVVGSGNRRLSMMTRWRRRHFTVGTASGPQGVELGHSKVVVSWLL